MTSKPALVAFAFAFASACGSGSATSTGTGSSGGTAEPVALPGGGTVPTVSCGDENVASASGTWNALVSGGGNDGQSSATITIDNGSFVFTQGSKSLAFSVSGASMTLTWSDGSRQAPISVTHRGDPVNTGLLPLEVGGQWSFASAAGDQSCTATFAANSLNATCNGVRSTPFGTLSGSVVGLRQRTSGSVFGELGGVWHFTGGGTGTVDATISGNVFTAVVNGNSGLVGKTGWVTVKVCNGTAAGKTSGGAEIAATRR